MSWMAVGINHKTGPLEVREKISFLKKGLKEALQMLRESERIESGVILSTCNRTEIYATTFAPEQGIQQLKKFISFFHEMSPEKLEPFWYELKNKKALMHLAEVCSGLDSQIVGETQVLGQVRFAYEEAKRAGTSPALNFFFEEAFAISSYIRKVTKISEGNLSIGSAAANLLRRNINRLQDKQILILGVGKVSNLLTKYLSEEKVRVVFVSNRNHEKARELASRVNGEAVGFDQLKSRLPETDIIISATSSPHLILKKEDFTGRKKPLFMIDLAVPRDIDPRLKQTEGIKLFDLDDLNLVIEETSRRRKSAAETAGKIIKEEVDRLWPQLLKLEQEPVLSH